MAKLAYWNLETQEEANEIQAEMRDNGDFTEIGVFTTLSDILDELAYQGISEAQAVELSAAMYGDVLEIYEYNGEMYAYIGAR